ncbi:MAG: ADOP family duplicated permease [Vicinamibacteria bacterium]
MRGLAMDVRLAARRLGASPGFALAAVLSLALGIGATTTIASLAQAVLLRPLPVAEPERVVAVYTSDYSGPAYGASSYPDYLDLRASGVFDGLVAYQMAPLGLAADGVSARVWAEFVTGDYFGTLGISVARGRALSAGDDGPGAAPVAVVSHALWQRLLGGDATVLGREVTLSGRPFTVVGVAPPGFAGLTRGLAMDLWVPMAARPALGADARVLEARGDRGLLLLGRLPAGVPLAAARARLATVAASLRAAHPQEWTDVRKGTRRIGLLPEWQARLQPMLAGPVQVFLALLGAIALVVLLTACANVANLFLARLVRRRREVAVRLSLGAGRGRLVRQFLAETLLVALAGGGLGTLLAYAATGAIASARLPLPLPVALDVHPDPRVLGLALALSLLTGLGLGLLPSLAAARGDVVAGLKDGVPARFGRGRLRGAFVVAQVALSLVLVCGAFLFLRGLGRAAVLDPGFDAGPVLAVPVDLVLSGYDEARAAAFEERLREGVAAHEGVTAVALAANVHLDPLGTVRRGLTVEGYAAAPEEDMEVHAAVVGAGFFEALGLPLVRGRGFTEADRPGTPRVAVVNETLARRYWPGQDPIGRRISISGAEGPFLDVVGVARDAKYGTLGEDPRAFFYVAFAQDFAFVRSMGEFVPATVLVRTSGGDPRARAAAVRQLVQDLDPLVTVSPARPLADLVGLSTLPSRVAGAVLLAFGALGLGLSALGLSGVVAQSVAQRTREFGVRLAIGADRGQIVRLALSEGLRLVAVGLAIGLGLGLALARLASSLLFGLPTTDPVTFVGAPALLLAVAAGAAWMPARRASRVDPVACLRSE